MQGNRRPLDWIVALAFVVGLCALGAMFRTPSQPLVVVPPLPQTPVDPSLPRVLVFTRTMKYRHQSIPAGVLAVHDLGQGKWTTEHTEDAGAFTPENLKRYAAVVFLSTTGDVLDAAQQKAFEDYVHAGGGFAGVHAAADTEYEWPWYGQLVGGWFRDHTRVIPNRVKVEDADDISMRGMPNPWPHDDEWYAYRSNPRPNVHVLGTIDDALTGENGMGGDHPIVWKHAFEGGRAWYTGLGHTKESYADPVMRAHLQGGILWAAGLVNDDGSPKSR